MNSRALHEKYEFQLAYMQFHSAKSSTNLGTRTAE